MRDESRTLDFRLKFVPTGKEELENLRFIPAVNVTEKPQLENAPSVKLVTETVKFSQTGPFILHDGLVAVGAKVDLPVRPSESRLAHMRAMPDTHTAVTVTRFAFLLSNSNHDAAIVMRTNEVAVGAGRRRLAFSFSKGPVLRIPSLGIKNYEQEVAAHHTAQAWQCCGKIAL